MANSETGVGREARIQSNSETGVGREAERACPTVKRVRGRL